MFEVLIAASLVAVVFAAFGQNRANQPIALDTEETDLPCPWCMGPTTESDKACNTCGQYFG